MLLVMRGYVNVMEDKTQYWFTIAQKWLYCSCGMLFYNSGTSVLSWLAFSAQISPVVQYNRQQAHSFNKKHIFWIFLAFSA